MGAINFSFTGFSLSTNLIPALKEERIDFRSVYATLCHAQSLIVMYTNIYICRVEAIQDIRSSYCYKVTWVNPMDIICFPTNYKHYTALITDIKKAINRLKNEGENKMNNKRYRVSNVSYESNPWQMDEITFTVNVLGSHHAEREDCERIKDAIESIGETKEKIVLDHHTLLRMFNKTFIKDVIFNNPATIVFWEDGTKTVVKAENEEFDPEKGLAMAIAKKALGNSYDYYDNFKKYVGRYEKKQKKGDN